VKIPTKSARSHLVTESTYNAKSTALLFVNPYDDFRSEGGKVWPLVKEVAEELGLLDNLRTINSSVAFPLSAHGAFAMNHRPERPAGQIWEGLAPLPRVPESKR
jgi:hypothetical protein